MSITQHQTHTHTSYRKRSKTGWTADWRNKEREMGREKKKLCASHYLGIAQEQRIAANHLVFAMGGIGQRLL